MRSDRNHINKRLQAEDPHTDNNAIRLLSDAVPVEVAVHRRGHCIRSGGADVLRGEPPVTEQKYFSVTATERLCSPPDAPVYELQINLDQKHTGLKLDVNVNGPIWFPGVYHEVAAALAQAAGLNAGVASKTGDTALLAKLLNGTPETIEQENQVLSGALEKDFTSPELHEQAALLLGAFLLRDHSGHFFEIRSPLSRMTAHLAMARFLSRTNSCGVNGQMAEAMLLTLIGDEAPALERLNAIGTNNAAVIPMVRALRTRNTGDYRPLGEADGLSRIECVEWFSALSDYVAAPVAWSKLSDTQQQTVDFVRVANQEGYSVEIGHQLLRVSVPLELQEIESVYEASHHEKLSRGGLVKALNEMPECCFTQRPRPGNSRARHRLGTMGHIPSTAPLPCHSAELLLHEPHVVCPG